MVGRRGQAFAYGAVGMGAFGAAVMFGWRALPGIAVGDADPVGMVVGLIALAVSVWGARLTVQSLRLQKAKLTDAAERLAREVLSTERQARQQLLGHHDKAINVRFTFRPTPAHNAQGADTDGQLEGVVDYYRRLQPQRMVITGAPGAGKTVLAVQLILRLLESRAPEDPVPVRLSLASWDTNRKVDDWIAGHLIRTYRLPAASAEALVKDRLVLPVLDGLDEMDSDPAPGYASRAGRALRALNGYLQATGKAKLVLTCRSQAHGALETSRVWAHDAARVEIQPVDQATARTFLTDRVDDPARWRGVHDALASDPYGPLATGLSTPWRLTLAVTVYEKRESYGAYKRDPRTLLSAALRTPDAVGEHLLGQFIPAATARHPLPYGTSYTAEEVHVWLTVLAGYLDRNTATDRIVSRRRLSGTDLVLHELWPLAGPRLPRVVHILLTVGVWALVLLPEGFLFRGWSWYAPGLLGYSLVAVLTAGPPWPVPSRLATLTRRRQTALGFVAGLAMGLMFGLGSGLGTGRALVCGMVSGGGSALVVGLTGRHEVSAAHAGTFPRRVVRDDLSVGLVAGLAFGGGFGLYHWFTYGFAHTLWSMTAYTLIFGLGAGHAMALIYMLTFGSGCGRARDLLLRPWRVIPPVLKSGGGPAMGAAGVRYVAFLLCTRKAWSDQPLPWRLGRFLDWCCQAGLMRTAGIGYQFRHRELQEFLATALMPGLPLRK